MSQDNVNDMAKNSPDTTLSPSNPSIPAPQKSTEIETELILLSFERTANEIKNNHKTTDVEMVKALIENRKKTKQAITALLTSRQVQLIERLKRTLYMDVASFEGNTPGKVWLDVDGIDQAIDAELAQLRKGEEKR